MCNLVHWCHPTIERWIIKSVTLSNVHPAIMHVKHSAREELEDTKGMSSLLFMEILFFCRGEKLIVQVKVQHFLSVFIDIGTTCELACIHRYDVHLWFVFTCIPLLPFILPMTKECRYSMHIAILSSGLDPKKHSKTSTERRPKCVAAVLLSEVQYVVQFHRTAAG